VSADRDFRDRFEPDVDRAAKLEHPNIARTLDRGEFEGRLWLASEYISGLDTGRSVRERYPAGMPRDLIPYAALTTFNPIAVMVGHLQAPDLTGTERASLSKAAYQLLRSGEYGGPGFPGLVYTDDLSSMGAINQHYSVRDAALLALQAGADTALWITTDQVPAVLDRLVQAVTTNELSMDRVNEALNRVALGKGPHPNCGR
jgi:hypothetical protein